MYILQTVTSKRQAVGAASAVVTTTMAAGKFYQFTSSTACYIRQSSGGTAAAAADLNSLVGAGMPVHLAGSNGAQLTVIQAAAGGDCTLTELALVGDY